MERSPRKDQVVPLYTCDEPEDLSSSDSDGFYRKEVYYNAENDEWDEYVTYPPNKDISMPKRIIEAQQRYFNDEKKGPFRGYPRSYWVANVLSENEYWRLSPNDISHRPEHQPATFTRKFFKHQAKLARVGKTLGEKCHANFCVSSNNGHNTCILFQKWMKETRDRERKYPDIRRRYYQEFRDFKENQEEYQRRYLGTEPQQKHECSDDCENPWCRPVKEPKKKNTPASNQNGLAPFLFCSSHGINCFTGCNKNDAITVYPSRSTPVNWTNLQLMNPNSRPNYYACNVDPREESDFVTYKWNPHTIQFEATSNAPRPNIFPACDLPLCLARGGRWHHECQRQYKAAIKVGKQFQQHQNHHQHVPRHPRRMTAAKVDNEWKNLRQEWPNLEPAPEPTLPPKWLAMATNLNPPPPREQSAYSK